MKTIKPQKNGFSVALAMVLIIAVAIPCIPNAFAQTFTPNARAAFAYATESPNPGYINSNVYIVGWVYPPPSVSGGLYPGLVFTVTKPDGTTFTRTQTSITEATSGFNYVVDQVGIWKVQLYFPGDTIRYDRTPATSKTYSFTVLNQTFPPPAYTALPDHPWSFPINSVNREWFRISGAWPKNGGNGYSYFSDVSAGPNTAHILWRFYLVQDSLLGGDQGHASLVRQSSRYSNPVVAMNRLYYSYNGAATPGTNPAQYPYSNSTFDDVTSQARHVQCLDLNNGEILWDTILPYKNYTTGQIVSAARTGGGTLQYVALGVGKGINAAIQSEAGGGELGSIALWVSGGGLWKLDPITGGVIWYQLTPVLSPTYMDGAWYIANYPVAGNYSCINANTDYSNGFPPIQLDTTSTVVGSRIWEVNMTTSGIPANPAVVGGYLVQLQTNGTTGAVKLNTWNAYTGRLVANGTWDTATADYASSGSNPVYGPTGYSRLGEDGRTRFYSYATGSLLWTSEQAELPWGTFGNYQGTNGNGLVIASNYNGYKYAYNDTNGKTVWAIYSGNQSDGTPNPYNYEYAENTPPTWGLAIVATNNVYYATGEHTPGTPHQRGDSLYAIEKDTGKIVWQLPYFKEGRWFDWSGVACNVFWAVNMYDGMVYFFGKGASETTVTATPVTQTGGATLIQGTVMDASTLLKGTPAVNDAGMSDWMEYKVVIGSTGPLINLTKVTGVPVKLTATNQATGETFNLGTVTSDAMGQFASSWTPPTSDLYKITAKFEGSESYYSSTAETHTVLVAGPTASPQITATPTPTPIVTASPIVTPTVVPTPTPTTPAGPGGIPASTMYAIAAAIVVIVIVAVAAAALRRRK